ncbi:hypothetical protein GCM10022255_086040 [Dactylosporangium darangshiense]|uniref:DEAD/DEAH box helicase n=1 Tax=Dactylosporangium darangshiense TaxID=579108 RepID=A0ABP8DMU0_9ACTN
MGREAIVTRPTPEPRAGIAGADLLEALAVPAAARRAAEAAIEGHLVGEAPELDEPDKLLRDAVLTERVAVDAYRRSIVTSTDDRASAETRAWFDRASSLWWFSVRRESQDQQHLFDERPDPRDGTIVSKFEELALRLAIAGLVAEQPARIRFEINELLPALRDQQIGPTNLNWVQSVVSESIRAFLLLVRKRDGWADVDEALSILQYLRERQADVEEQYLSSEAEQDREVGAAWVLLGAYHLAQMVTACGEYLQGTSDIAYGGLTSRLERHRDRAAESFNAGRQTLLAHYADLIWIGCRELARSSLWTHIWSLGSEVGEFARTLASRTAARPILELWPGQQLALNQRLLDPYPRAVVVEMPTSGGKTLLAEFSIVQTLALRPGSTVVYVVPTRALVNQVTRTLRSDLEPIGLTVEMTVPAYELDPAEGELLSQPINVLVTTPEKLDFLIRNQHRSVSDLSMVVVDEAHHLADSERGARLELVLATIRRDIQNVRFLLLTPFIKNALEVSTWLGGGRGAPPISVNWKPNSRVVGVITVDGRSHTVDFTTLNAVGNSDLGPGVKITLGPAQGQASSNRQVCRQAARVLKSRGTTLVLCRGPKAAIERAAQIAEDSTRIIDDPLLDVVVRYVDLELGADNDLSRVLSSGVAFHHSGLSHETRAIVERLISLNRIHTVCGTTTLAQGVNFPISNVIVEDIRKGFGGDLSYSEFWNIAGRAGRTMMDSVGLVGFPSASSEQQDRWQRYMTGEAEAIASQLAQVITAADSIGEHIGTNSVQNIPGLSEMLQFLAHAVRVSGDEAIAEELEDLLRGSLVYHQERANNPPRAARLVQLCRQYLDQIAGSAGMAALSDRTGFATPSVGMLLNALARDVNLQPADWHPGQLFGQNLNPLTERVRLLSRVPEINLGEQAHGPFSAEKAAMILRDWVQGEPIPELAARHGVGRGSDEAPAAVEFSRYLFGRLLHNASWGLGALRSVHLSGQQSNDSQSLDRYVPSMIYFGVATKEQVWLRMAGVPRPLAAAAATAWTREAGASQPTSHAQLRQFVSGLDPARWASGLQDSSLRPDDIPILWHELIRA